MWSVVDLLLGALRAGNMKYRSTAASAQQHSAEQHSIQQQMRAVTHL